jgi:hypothetical protein
LDVVIASRFFFHRIVEDRGLGGHFLVGVAKKKIARLERFGRVGRLAPIQGLRRWF